MRSAGVMTAQATENTCRYFSQFAYDSSNNLEFIGLAKIGSVTSEAKWQIRKLTWNADNNFTGITWAGGDYEFGSIWDNRASLVYS